MPRTADPGLRDRVLRTAGSLFYENGVRAVGMAQVVADAGCGKNALYRCFPSKTDLVAAYLAAFGRERDAETAQALAPHADDPTRALVELTRLVARHAAHEQFRGCAVRNYLREVREHDDDAGRTAVALVTAWRRRVEGLAGRLDVDDPQALAEQVWLVQEGLYAGTHADPVRAGEVAVAMVERLVGVA